MSKYLFLFLITLNYLLGCSADDSGIDDNLPTSVFSEQYALADFQLKEEYHYWEIRLGVLPQQDVSEYNVISSYDDISYQNLDSTQIQLINDAVSQSGFSAQCLPSFCPVYAVAIRNYDVSVIEASSDLIDFFGEIDTVAELSILLSYAQNYEISTQPETYEETSDGYLVVLNWDTLCQLRGKDLVKVHRDGKIEKIKEISRQSYPSCV